MKSAYRAKEMWGKLAASPGNPAQEPPMSPAALKERLRSPNFRPLRIVTTGGMTYDVRHPDMVIIGLAELVIGIPSKEDATIAQATHLVSLRHVVRLEPLEEASSASN